MEAQGTHATITPTGCCPPFDPTEWDEKEVTWKEKLFLKTHVPALLHVPIGMGKIVTRAMAQIERAGALAGRPLMLCDESSPFGEDLFISVSKPVPGAKMTTISGTFLTRVFEGPFQDMGKWHGQMRAYVAGKGRKLGDLMFAYTTCPACAKAYGKNYVIAFARVE